MKAPAPFREQHALRPQKGHRQPLEPAPERLRIAAGALAAADAGVPPIAEPHIRQPHEQRERQPRAAPEAGAESRAGNRRPRAERKRLHLGTVAAGRREDVKAVRVIGKTQRLEGRERRLRLAGSRLRGAQVFSQPRGKRLRVLAVHAVDPAADFLPHGQPIGLRPARKITPAHADTVRRHAHRQPLALADVAVGGEVHGFIHADIHEVQRPALPLGMVLMPRDVVLRMRDPNVVAVIARRGVDALLIRRALESAEQPRGVGRLERGEIQEIERPPDREGKGTRQHDEKQAPAAAGIRDENLVREDIDDKEQENRERDAEGVREAGERKCFPDSRRELLLRGHRQLAQQRQHRPERQRRGRERRRGPALREKPGESIQHDPRGEPEENEHRLAQRAAHAVAHEGSDLAFRRLRFTPLNRTPARRLLPEPREEKHTRRAARHRQPVRNLQRNDRPREQHQPREQRVKRVWPVRPHLWRQPVAERGRQHPEREREQRQPPPHGKADAGGHGSRVGRRGRRLKTRQQLLQSGQTFSARAGPAGRRCVLGFRAGVFRRARLFRGQRRRSQRGLHRGAQLEQAEPIGRLPRRLREPRERAEDRKKQRADDEIDGKDIAPENGEVELQVVRAGREDIVRLRAQPVQRRGAVLPQRVLHAPAGVARAFHRLAREQPPEETADETAARNRGKKIHLAQPVALRQRLEHAERKGRAADAAAGQRETHGFFRQVRRVGRGFLRPARLLPPLADGLSFRGLERRGIDLRERVFEQRVRRLFADHKDGCENKVTGDFRKHRGIHHAQPSHAMHAKAAVQHRLLVRELRRVRLPLVRTHAAGAGGMMPPSLRPHPLLHFRRLILPGFTRLNLADKLLRIPRIHLPHKGHGIHQRRQVAFAVDELFLIPHPFLFQLLTLRL